jgi:hypothetical protein
MQARDTRLVDATAPHVEHGHHAVNGLARQRNQLELRGPQNVGVDIVRGSGGSGSHTMTDLGRELAQHAEAHLELRGGRVRCSAGYAAPQPRTSG